MKPLQSTLVTDMSFKTGVRYDGKQSMFLLVAILHADLTFVERGRLFCNQKILLQKMFPW